MQKSAFSAACLSISAALLLAACNSPPADESTAAQPSAPATEQAAPPDQPETPPPPASAASLATGNLDQVLAGSWRSDAEKARDQYRHPKQTLDFFGLKPDMTAVEITPGGGWYAEILAPFLNAGGHYVAAVAKPSKPDGEAAKQNAALRAKFAADPTQYGNAKVIEFDPKAPNFGPSGSADMVVTFRNIHNWVAAGTAPAMFKAFFDVLKPGGILGVTDHRAAPGSDVKKTEHSGYLPQDYVESLATGAGFKLADQSEINANAKDTRDHEKGVWTLPPTLTLGDKDKAKYLAIGESDRMTLKFVKPKGDQIFEQGADHTGKAADGTK
ncbi:MAG: methyltransferase [Rhodanobacteraceae bacterium]